MRTLILSIATVIAFLTAPAFEVPLTYNPLVQNWQNGSQNTCPYGAGNATVTQLFVLKPYTPPVVEEEPAEETVG